MKAIWIAGGVFLASMGAFAQADLAQGNDGTASYGYSFDLPPARGRYQPRLALSYNSGAGANIAGVGWSLNLSYIEPNTRASLAPDGGTRSGSMTAAYPTSEWWLTINGASRILVTDPANPGTGVDFRPDVDSGYTKVHRNTVNNNWTMTDGVGNVYTFALPLGTSGQRYYLTTVVDVDGNTTWYNYQIETSPDGTLASSALLTAILYNNKPAASGDAYFVSAVVLGYQAAPNPQAEVIDNILTEHSFVLSGVSVERFATGVTPFFWDSASPPTPTATLKSYSLTYQQSSQTGRLLLTNIAQYGSAGGPGDGGVPIDQGLVLSYSAQSDAGPWYSVSAQTSSSGFPTGTPLTVAQCASILGNSQPGADPCLTTDIAAYVDIDGDGLPDMVWATTLNPGAGIWWAKNASVPGSISFAQPAPLSQASPDAGWPGQISFADSLGMQGSRAIFAPMTTAGTQFLDVNGDGKPDLVQVVDGGYLVSYNDTAAGGFDPPVGVTACWANGTCPAISTSGLYTGIYSALTDVNGDGLPDYVFSAAGPSWEFFAGYLDTAGHWQLSQSPQSLQVPGSAMNINGTNAVPLEYAGGVPNQSLVDMNGDGYLDLVSNVLTANNGVAWNVLSASPRSFAPLAFDALGSSPDWSLPSACSAVYPSGGCSQNGTSGTSPAEGILQDVNGDGKPDYVYDDGSGVIEYLLNTGNGFSTPVSTGVKGIPFAEMSSASSCPTCYNSGYNQMFVDLDGDGVLDRLTVAPNQPPSVQLGRTADGAPKPDLLIAVVTPLKQQVSITYGSSLSFGAVAGFRPHPVVTKVTTSTPIANGGVGAAALVRSLSRWYQSPHVIAAWDDPSRLEQLGFQTTWTLDSTTNLTTQASWGVSHQFAGVRMAQSVGVYTSMSLPSYLQPVSVPQSSVFDSSLSLYDTCPIGAGIYPVLTTTLGSDHQIVEQTAGGQSVTLESMSSGSDTAGNIKQMTYVRDVADTGSAFTVTSVYPSLSASQAVCKNCALEAYATSAAWPQGDLFRRRYHYDAAPGVIGAAPVNVTTGHLNYVEELVSGSGDTGLFENGLFTAYDSFGMVKSVTRFLSAPAVSSVTTSYTYDSQTHLHLVESKTYDTGTQPTSYSLFAQYSYDDAKTGVLSSIVGPFTSTAPSQPSGGFPTTSLQYDVYLRQIGAWRTDTVGGAPYWISARGFQNATATTLASAWSASFASNGHPAASALTITPFGAAAGPPQFDDVVSTRSFYSGSGRVIQTRTALGTGAAGASNANVMQGLSANYLVRASTVDAAGRTIWAFDPYYSSSSGFEDVSTTAPSTSAQLHATNIWYDAKSRPYCNVYQPVSGTLATAVVGSCKSQNGIRATVLGYGAGSPTGVAGRSFLLRTSASDSQNAIGAGSGTVTSYVDAGGAAMYSADEENNVAYLVRDPLGRTVKTVRTATGGGGVASSVVYDAKGRVAFAQDASSGGKVYTYSPTGELVSIGEGPTNQLPGGSMGVKFAYGTLGRLVQKTPFKWTATADAHDCGETWAAAGASAPTSYGYDVPYGAAGAPTSFAAGRLTWAANDVSTIALSYDVSGNVTQRAEAYTGWQSSTWNTVNRTYRADGAVTSTSLASPALTSTVTYNTWYDSVGRPVEVENGSNTVFWATSPAAVVNPQYASGQTTPYDALGRLGSVGSGSAVPTTKGYWFDNGKGAAHFNYDPTSNQLTAYDSNVTPSAGQPTEMIAVTNMLYQGSKLHSYQEAVSGNSYSFSYDISDRLQAPNSVASSLPPGLDPNVHQTYNESASFDISASSSLWNIQSVNNLATSSTATYTYGTAAGAPSLDQLSAGSDGTSVTYEQSSGGAAVPGRGVVASYKDATGATWNYLYDEEMRLVSITGAAASETIKYGPLGGLALRTLSTGTTQYRVGDELVISVVAGSATAVANVTLGGGRLATVSGSSVLYYHRDRLGSVIGTSTSGGNAGAKYRYDAYGLLTGTSNLIAQGANANASELGYTGALTLSGGLVYLHARVYSPAMRRFLQADNVDAKRYTYAYGDPSNQVDPSGHFPTKRGSEQNVCVDGMCNGAFADSFYWGLGGGGGAYSALTGDGGDFGNHFDNQPSTQIGAADQPNALAMSDPPPNVGTVCFPACPTQTEATDGPTVPGVEVVNPGAADSTTTESMAAANRGNFGVNVGNGYALAGGGMGGWQDWHIPQWAVDASVGFGNGFTFGALGSWTGGTKLANAGATAYRAGTWVGVASFSSLGISYAMRPFTAPSQLVTHWGGQLAPGGWVMTGGNTLRNYIFAGIWSKYALGDSVSIVVDEAELSWPSGIEFLKGLLGQRIYNPGG